MISVLLFTSAEPVIVAPAGIKGFFISL